VLYDVVMRTNNRELNFHQALKYVSDNVHGAGGFTASHILAVLTLTGNCINRDFLRKATLGEACKKHVRDRIFPSQSIASSQMKTTLNGVVRNLGLSEFIVENLLCEALRPKQGFDTFHPTQSIFFLHKDADVIVCINGDNVQFRSVEDDKKVLLELPETDQVVPLYQWWEARAGIDGIHEWFLQICDDRKMDPASLVICPHLNAIVILSNNQVWN
jgi:hypothetical protein